MRFLPLFALAVLTLALACNKKVGEATTAPVPAGDNSTVVKVVAFDQSESLRVGEACKLDKANVLIKFVEVNLDSRCPRGVNCIQAGEARVTISINGEPQRITIDTDSKTTARARIPGGTVEVLSLDPYPQAEVRVKPEDRRLRIRMVKSADM